MLISKLDVVNKCLATIGEVPLNSLDTDHPYAGAAARLIPECNARIQARGWWFNKETIQAHPDAQSKEIVLPADFLGVDTETAQLKYVVRGRRLYDLVNRTYQFEEPVWVDIIRLIKFDELPYTVADLVRADVVVQFVESYDADQLRVQQVRADFQRAERICNTEHARNANVNMFEDGEFAVRRASTRYPTGYGRRGLRTR